MGISECKTLIATAQQLARQRELQWDTPIDEEGNIFKEHRWNLNALIGTPPPPLIWLGTTRIPANAEKSLREMCLQRDVPCPQRLFLDEHWLDFYKAIIINELLIKKNTLSHVNSNIAKIIRIIGVVNQAHQPWEINADDVRHSYNVALGVGSSGKIAANFEMVVRLVFDGMQIADTRPLAQYCLPYRDRQNAQNKVDERRIHERTFRQTVGVRTKLSERNLSKSLPDKRAFWELVEIIFTELPKTFADFIRFRILQLCIITGLRIGEVVSLPADCLRWRSYATKDGQPAEKEHGISQSLTLKYFAEKTLTQHHKSSVILTENIQHVPPLYADVVEDLVQSTLAATSVMRSNLEQQIERNSLFPDLDQSALIPAYEAYARVTGNIAVSSQPVSQELIALYRAHYQESALRDIYREQEDNIAARGIDVTPQISSLHTRWREQVDAFDCNGVKFEGNVSWSNAYFKVSQIEAFLRKHRRDKMPDWIPGTLHNGSPIYPYQHLFLMPIRALGEGRNAGITDLLHYYAIGKSSAYDIMLMLDGKRKDSIFARYRPNIAEDLAIKTHSFRHLQNTELMRLGVADTVISKRFRKDVRHSASYDHRSLFEELQHIEIEDELVNGLSERSQNLFKMIKEKKIAGPIVSEFYKLQDTVGLDDAIAYLQTEADGFHVTPYGVCLNAFTVDTCPNHLECFNNCKHLARTKVKSEEDNLRKLKKRLSSWIDQIERQPIDARSLGWENQLKHAQTRLDAVNRALDTKPGEKVSPNGDDRYDGGSPASATILDV